jgi:hypothetical protein
MEHESNVVLKFPIPKLYVVEKSDSKKKILTEEFANRTWETIKARPFLYKNNFLQ